MLYWSDIFLVFGYETLAFLFALLLSRYARRDKDLEMYFDGIYFLTRWCFNYTLLAQAGLFILVCSLFWHRQALLVGSTVMFVIPFAPVIGGMMQYRFYRRYNLLQNLIRRIERLGPADRASLLESLPPDVFQQLPGDYRFVTWEQNRRPL